MNRVRTWATLTVAVLAPTVGTAQAVATSARCASGDPVGSLGITGIQCERCQFYTNGKVHRALFWTEPTITQLDHDMPASSVLRQGDVLVAVDGQLITTREGSARFSALPPTGEVTLRVRRDGRVRDMSVPVTAVCPEAKDADLPVVVGRPLPPSTPAPVAPPLPFEVAGGIESVPPVPPTPPAHDAAPAPRAPEARLPGLPDVPDVPELPALPAPPAPEAMAPRAELGFAFSCSHCGYTSTGGGTWSFPEPPEVSGVSPVGIGGSSGLRSGDRILQIDGVDITTPAGGRRFAAIKPGDHPRWTVERNGTTATVVTTANRQVNTDVRAETAIHVNPSPGPLRFTGTVGNTAVEVRGGKVNVIEAEGGSLLIIRTRDSEIRIRVPGGGG